VNLFSNKCFKKTFFVLKQQQKHKKQTLVLNVDTVMAKKQKNCFKAAKKHG